VTHNELRESLEVWAIGALRQAEAAEVERHFVACDECRQYAQSLALVPLALASVASLATPPAAARARLLSVVAGKPVDVLPKPAPTIAASAASPAAWLALAASLIVAAYLGWDDTRLRGRIADLTRELAQARAAVAANETRLAALQHTADQSQSAFAVLVAPDVARIDLAGQPDAPNATGRAFWSRARGMVFSATALPPPPPGRTYQVWVVTSTPAPISAGLIAPDENGRVSTVFATPPDIPQPVAVAVTLEPAGGVPAPTGPKVLVGTV
jgi:hypothetical protein